jgi:hypothetical protein
VQAVNLKTYGKPVLRNERNDDDDDDDDINNNSNRSEI